MLNHILAKSSGETLIRHTDEIVSRWEVLKEIYSDKISVDDEFWEFSFLSVLFHDTGKVALNFQERIRGKVNHYDDYIRHEFLSGLFLLFSDKEKFLKSPLPLLAVFSHHKPLVDDKLFLREKQRTLRVSKVDLEKLAVYINEKIQTQPFKFNSALILEFSQTRPLEPFYLLFRNLLSEVGISFNEKSRIQYIFYKAILNTADWSASGHKELTETMPFNEKQLRDKTIQKLRNEGKSEIADSFKWKDFQTDCLNQNDHVLAIAPTGSGKTEAALLWASKKAENEKIIYLLPTRVTSNAIYQRLIQYFGKQKTAVVHSSAFFYQKDLNDNFDKAAYLVDKTFFKNVNICTVDQVLTQGFNLGYWEIKTFHMLNARVVIDEIHLYAPYTLGLIVSTIKYLKDNFGTRFFIMTATMPAKLQKLLKDTLEISETQIVKDQQLLNEARNIFETRPCLVDELKDEIIKELKAGKKVLIVVNTVDEAIRLYEKFHGIAEKTICYHSRFIQKDRLQKEKEILDFEQKSKSLLLISTQVVEVSLDIDFDILFTENAPMDAIIQRAGRVNRKRKKENTKVIVFKEQEVTRAVIYTEVEDILENTFKELESRNGHRLTENILVEMVDAVYEKYEIKTHPKFTEGCHIYIDIQRKHHFVKDNTEYGEVYTREGLDSETVIPSRFYEKLKIDKFDPIEMAKHELSIRRKKLHAIKNKFSYHSEDHYQFLGCKYTYEVGFELDNPSREKCNF